jgi:GNAT superfamily N-acetyltransferase
VGGDKAWRRARRCREVLDPVEGDIEVQRIGLEEIALLREEYRRGAGCQIVHDSILARGLADPYLLVLGGEVAGYAGVWTKHFPDRILEFFAVPQYRARAAGFVRAIAAQAEARELEVQTNLYDGRTLIEECSVEAWTEKFLFQATWETDIERPDLTFRRRVEGDQGPGGPWVIEWDGRIVGAGGWLTHYNPPYADIYMEVSEGARRQGVGAYLVQELRRACSREGHTPVARCDPSNEGSRRALERGGFRACGEILVGRLGSSP